MYAREITVQPSDVSSFGVLKLKNLLDYFQDTAGLAVENIEGSSSELIARGYAWILTRYEIEFLGNMPALDEKFVIKTFHDPNHGYNTLRVFDVSDKDGKPIIWAKTSWLLLDLAAQRPVKPIANLPEITSRDTAEINPDFQDIPNIDENEIIKTVEFPVRFHDLDYNAHVNNAVYFAWVYDETPLDFTAYELKSVFASFRTGARFGEKVTLNYSSKDDVTMLCEVTRENIKKPSANFLCTWQKKRD